MAGSRKAEFLKGAAAGTAAGIVGVITMTAQQLLFDSFSRRLSSEAVRELSERGGRHDIAQLKERAQKTGLRQRDATVRTAEVVAKTISGQSLARRHRHIAGLTVHYTFAAVAGALHGMVAERYEVTGLSRGLLYGGVLWLFAEEVALPVSGLTKAAGEYSLQDHASGLAAHLMFGYTTARVQRWIRQQL
jgi:Protein of unknown function (DUF1440)